jgi:hypothetical protein
MVMPGWRQKQFKLVDPPREDTTGVATANLDTDEGSYATIKVHLGSELNTNNTGVVLSLLESDDTNASNFATVTADQTVDNTNEGTHTYHVDLRGRKRYLRISITPDTTTNGLVVYSADAVLERLTVGPSGTATMTDDTTNDTITFV